MSTNKSVYWKNVFTRYGYECDSKPQDCHGQLPQLNINLGPDTKGRLRTLEMRLDSRSLPQELAHSGRHNSGAKESKELQVIHLFVALPFFVAPQNFGEMARLLLLLNKPLEIPGFGLDENAGVAFFRYSLLTYHCAQSQRLLLAIVGTIMLLIDALTPQIEAVAAGATIKDTLTGYAQLSAAAK